MSWTKYQNGYLVGVIINGEYDTISVANADYMNLLFSQAGKLLDEIKVDTFGVLYPEYSAVVLAPLSNIMCNNGLLYINDTFTGSEIDDYAPVYIITIQSSGPSYAEVYTSIAADYTQKATFNNAGIYVVKNTHGEADAIYIIINS